MRVITVPVLLVSLAGLVLADSSARTVHEIVQDANRFLAEGSYAEAARAYTEALDIEPSYSNHYKRATAYLSLGRNSAALDDFDAILRLNPAFTQAHFQKAKILAKEGEFGNAGQELRLYTKQDQDGTELGESISLGQAAESSARTASKQKRWRVCVDHATKALEVGPNSIALRELRVDCAIELGDIDAVFGDLNRLAILRPSDMILPIRLTNIAYFVLASPNAITHVKKCLHYDPDSKSCKRVHKLIRSFEKDTAKVRNFVEGSTWRQAMKILDGPDGLLARFDKALEAEIGAEGGIPKQFDAKKNSQARLELYSLASKATVGANDFGKKGMGWCEETLKMDEGNADALVGRGEKLLKEENWEEATRVFEQAFENSGRSSQDILNRVQKAQRLLKVSKQKDYYKVLGVPRDADERTIKKAFRTAAKTAHPDVGGTQEKMAQLNEAYEVLSDEGLRARYDNGDDPNDPQQGQGGGGNPFAHHGGGMPFQFFQQGGGGGGFPFGGGGGQKMHFQWG